MYACHNNMACVHTIIGYSLSDCVVAVTISSLLLAVPYWAVRVMSHSLPGGMLEKVADVLKLVVMGVFGAGSGSPQSNIQTIPSMYPVGGGWGAVHETIILSVVVEEMARGATSSGMPVNKECIIVLSSCINSTYFVLAINKMHQDKHTKYTITSGLYACEGLYNVPSNNGLPRSFFIAIFLWVINLLYR